MLQTGGQQLEHVRYFVNALSCSSASQLVTIAGFTQAIFSQIAASIQFKSDARTHGTPKHCVRKCTRNAGSVLRKLSECVRVPASLLWSSSGFRVRCDSGLERNAMIGPGRV